MQTSTVTSTKTQTTTEMIDNIQIQKGLDVTIFELWNGCPKCNEMNGHKENEQGIFLIVIKARTFVVGTPLNQVSSAEIDNEHSSVMQGPFADEEAGMAVLDGIAEQNAQFIK